ncbi:MAG: outer membrane lipoprotein carrier protein LolA [Panacagrimonas sp.]
MNRPARGLVVALLMLLAASASRAADGVFDHPVEPAQLLALLGAPVRELARAEVLRGQFTQQRFLHELPVPLRSSGDFLFARGSGIIWHTREPFDTEVILTPASLVQKDGGTESLRLSSTQQPALRVAEKLFSLLLSLDVTRLSADFDLFGVPRAAGWEMGLRPRSAAMAAAFERVRVVGDEQLRMIELNDRNGDRSEIRLDAVEPKSALSPEQRMRFES